MEGVNGNPADKDLPFTPLDQRLQTRTAPAGTRFERHVKPASWRAFSLRQPFLYALLALSLALLGGIEALRQTSNRHHGLQHLGGFSATRLTTGQNILYSYIPTVTGVLYSTLWSYIDLDTRRLEPYIQMRSNRSPASNLILDYVFESALATPVRALRRRHWTLAAVSTTFLLISLILPASQGALFGIDSISYSIEDESFDLGHKYLVSGTLSDGEFINQAESISIPNGSEIPSWTTANYAVSAFSAKNRQDGGNETWTARTFVYYAEPICRRFETERKTFFDGGPLVTFSSGQILSAHDLLLLVNISVADAPSCKLTVGIMFRLFGSLGGELSQEDYLFSMFTYGFSGTGTTSGITGVSIQVPQPGDLQYDILANSSTPTYWREPSLWCPNIQRLAGLVALDFSNFNVSPTFPWEDALSNIKSSLALYSCKGQCNWAIARATVDAGTQAVLNIDQLASQTSFSIKEFDVETFESYLEFGRIGIENITTANVSEPGLWAISGYYGLGDVVVSNLSAQVNQSSYLSLFNGDSIGAAFEAGYRLIFALMFNGFLQPSATQGTVTGLVQVDTFTIVIVPAFAIISEALLALAAAVLIALLLGYHRRISVLRSDPESIAAQCSIIVDEFSDVDIMRSTTRNLELLSTKQLEEQLQHSHLEYSERSGSLKVVTMEQELALLTNPSRPNTNETVIRADPLPFFMSKRGISSATVLLTAVLAALIFLAIWAHTHHGFDYLTNSLSFRSQLFWSFMPTLIATFIETCWGTLHRDLSVLETWVAIRKRHTRAQESLSLRYSSRPPSLVAWMASKRRHWMLFFVSCLYLTTGILNIAMAGLFLNSVEDFASSVSTASQYTTTKLPEQWVDQNVVNNAFGVLRTELSNDGKLPAWTSHNLSFIPVLSNPSASVSSESNNITFESVTSGIGSSLGCVELPKLVTMNSSGPGLYTDSQGTQSLRFKPQALGFEVDETCMAAYDVSNTVQSIFFQPLNRFNITSGGITYGDIDGCGSVIILVCGQSSTQTITLYNCRSSISVSEVSVQYDEDQAILSQRAISTTSRGTAVLGNEAPFLAFYRSQFMEAAALSIESLPTTEYDWPGLLMTRIRKNSATRSIPELAASVWQRVFAIWFSLYHDNLLVLRKEGDASFSSATGTAIIQQARIMPSIPAFVVSILLIFLYLVSFVVVVWRRRHRYAGPRMPKTIGSIMPWVVHSRMLEDFAGLHYVSSHDRDDALQRMDRRYGFGRFRGRTGRVTLGIEYEELLMASGAHGDF